MAGELTLARPACAADALDAALKQAGVMKIV